MKNFSSPLLISVSTENMERADKEMVLEEKGV